MKRLEAETRLPHLTAAALVLLCASLALMIGDIGFQGDDWWQFSWPYWHSFPNSIWEYAKESRRPVEGLYTVLSFDAFGLNRTPYTFTALLLLAASGLVMGICLRNSFPERPSLSVAATFFVFLLPPLSNLIYMFCTDNSRISSLFFWFSVWAFQRWAAGSASWSGLMMPVLLYLLAALTYENTTFLIFSVPLFLWPIHVHEPRGRSDAAFFYRLFLGIAVGFAGYVLIRFLFLSGGAVGHAAAGPSTDLVRSYLTNLVLYCVAPLQGLSWDLAGWIWAAVAGLLFAGLLYLATTRDSKASEPAVARTQESLYIGLLGMAVLGLGMVPYFLAGYNSSIGYTSQSRIYSSAGFGVAILLGLAVTGWNRRRLLTSTGILAVILATLMAAFFANLRVGWQEAAEKRSQLCASLLKQVPDAAPGTTFLFLDLQWYISTSNPDSAVVFQGVDGLAEFIRMLYGKRDLYAYFLYPDSGPVIDEEGRRATVCPEGLTARGSWGRSPIRLDSLLILQRKAGSIVSPRQSLCRGRTCSNKLGRSFFNLLELQPSFAYLAISRFIDSEVALRNPFRDSR